MIDATGNYQGQYYGTVKLITGDTQVVNAYSLARVFVDSTVRYSESDPESITLILGEVSTTFPALTKSLTYFPRSSPGAGSKVQAPSAGR